MNNNLLIYGSVARGDSTKFSDIDLLTVGNDISRKIIIDKTNVSYYNISKFKEMASMGSLFIFHLNQEAKILYDDGDILSNIIYNEFTLKPNYNEEILFALDLLNEISLIYNKTKNFSFANSKIAWCLRTIYSGLGANSGRPIYSTNSILNSFGNNAIEFLSIKKKSTNQYKLLPKILSHAKSIIDFRTTIKLEFRNDLTSFKEKVLTRIIYRKNSMPFDY